MEQVEILKKGSDSFHSGKLSKEDEKNFEAEENSARKRNVKKD